jgi:predicted HD superfamily hydrolase involved in NAD metabolism
MSNKCIEVISKYISKKRVQHCLRVSETAGRLAEIHGANTALVQKAGWLHDIAKNQTPTSMSAIGIDVSEFDECWAKYPSVWHALVGPKLIRYEFQNQPNGIDDMVRYHTTGYPHMSLGAAIVFIADFIEPERSHERRCEIANIAEKNINEAVAWITYESIRKLTKKKVTIHPYTQACWDRYCKYIVNGEKWHTNENAEDSE